MPAKAPRAFCDHHRDHQYDLRRRLLTLNRNIRSLRGTRAATARESVVQGEILKEKF
jgi:hypothetical protein